MQSSAYVRHFGKDTPVVPGTKDLEFDTKTQAGTNNGQPVTFAQIYNWMGETAREQVFVVLNKVLNDHTLTLKVFAYDLAEPDVAKILLTLAEQGRVRVILDNADLHVTQSGKPKTPEDQFTDLFNQQKKAPSDIVRGSFARYSHDKIFIVLRDGSAIEVLTGSTNFSLTGLYVNANHVRVFEDANVAGHYDQVFEKSWQVLSGNKSPSAAAANAFSGTTLATVPYDSQPGFVPKMQITFSPHTKPDVNKILGDISNRITQETHSAKGNVIFAVMQLARSSGSVVDTLGKLHSTRSVTATAFLTPPWGFSSTRPARRQGSRSPASPAMLSCRRHSTRCRAFRVMRSTTNSWSAVSTAMIQWSIAAPQIWQEAAKPRTATTCSRSTTLTLPPRSRSRRWASSITIASWTGWPIRRPKLRRRQGQRRGRV